LETKRAYILNMPGVVGVGRGQRCGQDVIIVMVKSRDSAVLDRIPASIEGYSVLVEEVGIVGAT
jgi:hypothetical protein